jgi:hypothetical protein
MMPSHWGARRLSPSRNRSNHCSRYRAWTGLRTSLHGFAGGSSSSISSPLGANLVGRKWQASDNCSPDSTGATLPCPQAAQRSFRAALPRRKSCAFPDGLTISTRVGCACIAQCDYGRSSVVHPDHGQTHGTCQSDIERIQVRALAAEIAGLQHRGDVANAAAARLRIAECVIDDPLVDATRLRRARLDATSRQRMDDQCEISGAQARGEIRGPDA